MILCWLSKSYWKLQRFLKNIEALVKNKNGRIVSKKASAKGKTNKWIKACVAARKALGVKGFSVIKKGTALYKKAKSLYK